MQNPQPKGKLVPAAPFFMTQSPPKASPSSRPPAAPSNTDGGRRITALAAGGSVLLISAAAVALWPRTYGTSATFVLDSNSRVSNPVALAGRIEAALLEREELATFAMDLPPALRSPDPIGRLRAGIRVQSRGALGFTVEFRGSDPQSVQRIANRLAERAVKLVPKLATSPADNAFALALAERSRAVTEFLTAHPEINLELSNGKPNPAGDRGLDALRSERRQIEQRLASRATDNPYTDVGQSPELLSLRLAEIKTTIARRENALKQPSPATPPTVSPELTSQWRGLLADLASAQAAAVAPPPPGVSGHITARAPLPGSPLTPNRLVLSIVAALLSAAAAMIAYVLPRKAEPARRPPQHYDPPDVRAEPAPPMLAAANHTLANRSDPPMAPSGPPPPQPSEPPIAGRPSSEPPGPVTVQRTVVVSSNSGSAPPAAPTPAPRVKRSQTMPGGLHGPGEANSRVPDAAAAPRQPAHSPPAAPLFGSRPPPGAGSYSVSSSHPPPGPPSSASRTSVERLSPLQSARPPSTPAPSSEGRAFSPVNTSETPQIVSRPPALDPDAETWATRFDTVPPPPPAPEDASPRRRSGRWKTQVMGSMVPLEVTSAREERPQAREPDSIRPAASEVVSQTALAISSVPPGGIAHHDLYGWSPAPELGAVPILAVRDAVLEQLSLRRLSLAVTGAAGPQRAQVAAALAFALAQSGARVLLIEADFDRPELHRTLAVAAPPGAGFSQQLRARRSSERPRPWTVVRCTPNLNVMVEGRMRSPGQLVSGMFEGAIEELRGHHHVVIIHAPSLDKRGDLRPLAAVTQAAILVQLGQPPSVQFGDSALLALL